MCGERLLKDYYYRDIISSLRLLETIIGFCLVRTTRHAGKHNVLHTDDEAEGITIGSNLRTCPENEIRERWR